MAVVLVIPSKKKAIFKVIEKTPTKISFGKSILLILIFFVWARKNGAKNKEAKAKRRNAKVMGGNSCKVILATTKFAPQIMWAKSKAIYGKGLLKILELIYLRVSDTQRFYKTWYNLSCGRDYLDNFNL